MNVAELIALLEKVEDKTRRVEIAVRQYNKAYPVAYLDPWTSGAGNYPDQMVEGVTRLQVSLPENMRTSTLKPK